MTTEETPNGPPASPPEGAKRRTFVWRILAIALILASMVGLAHYMRQPSRLEGGPDATAASKPGEDVFAPAPPPKATDLEEAGRQKAQALRKIMGGLVMEAADEDGPYNDPANKDPEDRRRFLADIFGLPFDFPQNQVADDLAPKGAHVLVVFEDPAGQGKRVVLMRVPGGIDEALAAVSNHYKAAGYEALPQEDPATQPDRGWLMRFTKDKRERVVYARPRDSDKETLVAVYDEPR